MDRRNIFIMALIAFVYVLTTPSLSFGEEKPKEKQPNEDYTIPDHVLNISKENTFPNSSEDQEVVEPSKLTKSFMEEIDVPIENPNLIKLLNETTLKPSPIAIGYRGMIFLGRWPLNYKSMATTINWEYQQINTNELNNFGSDVKQILRYNQQEQKEVKGALTSKIVHPDEVKQMMLLKAQDKTNLPLSYRTVVGKNTKKDHSYHVPVKKHGYLHAHVPAVNEKGQMTFGEVYIELKGTKKSIVVKNVTKQGIGAWIPIHDHISFTFQLKD
ncbi:MAG TPA: YfkD family protein [Bacillota bacterium]|nr:YfkD family protein [Bacillota bacterium]